jgi:hypothetical protein
MEEATTKQEASTQNGTHRTAKRWTKMSTKERAGTSRTPRLNTMRWTEMLESKQHDEALEEAVLLHNSIPRRVLGGHSEAPSSQSEEEIQSMSVTREGYIEVMEFLVDKEGPRRRP